MSEPFFILFRDGPPDDWSRAAQVLDEASPTLARGDATRACRFGFGLVPSPLPEAEAVQVAAALDRAGLPTVLLPFRSLIRAPTPFVLSNADAYPDGLHIQVDLRGTLQMLAWPSLSLILVECVRPRSVASSTLSTSTGPRRRPSGWNRDAHTGASPLLKGLSTVGDALMTNAHGYWSGDIDDYRVGAYGSPRLPESRPAKRLDPEVWLELFVLKPLMRMRIRQNAFNYDYLEERLTTSSRRNFALLIKDILKYAPKAAKMGQIGPALVGLPMDHPKKIIEEKDHERAVTALLTRESIVGLPRPGA